MFDIYYTLGLMLFSGACGFYLGHRGFTGVESDISDIKNDIVKLKASNATQVTVNTPAVVTTTV